MVRIPEYTSRRSTNAFRCDHSGRELNLCDKMKNVGAHSPTKIPNRSAWAASPFLKKNQIAMDATIERNPATKQALLI
jgi:hypothetical protein